MNWNTIATYTIVFVIMYIVIDYYSREFFDNLRSSFKYGVPRLATPLTIQYQIEDKKDSEGFTFTRQDDLSPLGPSSLPKPLTNNQTHYFTTCEQGCRDKINKCLAAGNPQTCEYNYQICVQDCIWNANINSKK